MSIDERDDLEDEEEGQAEGLPFILHPDIISAYGTRYTINLDSDGVPVVTSLEAVESAKCGLYKPRC